MVGLALKRFLVVVIALALTGGPVLPLTASANSVGALEQPMVMAGGVPCDQMDMSGQSVDAGKSAPCNSMDFNCMLKMGCLASSAALAVMPGAFSNPVAYSAVSYKLTSTARTGLSLAPDPFPPKSLA